MACIGSAAAARRFVRRERAFRSGLSFFAVLSAFWAAPPTSDAAARPPNIVLVVVDALRADHLSLFGYQRPTSPFLKRLAAESVVYRNAVAAASQTVPSVTSLLTGKLPSEHGLQFFRGSNGFHPDRSEKRRGPLLPDTEELLSEHLQRAGYRTAAVITNPWLNPRYGFDQGFEVYRFLECRGDKRQPGCDALEVNRAVAEVLTPFRDAPYFLYVHYMDVHNPYYNPKTFRGLFTAFRGKPRYRNGPIDITRPDLEYAIAFYDEQIRYVDSAIEALVSSLSRDGDPVVAITADHGDEFLEHGGMGHGTSLYEELVRSFVILHAPGRLAPEEVRRRVSHLDLAPALLSLAGSAHVAPADRLRKPEHGSAESAEPIRSELGDLKAAFMGRWKLISDPSTGRDELYDLRKDPGERRDRAEDPDRRQLRSRLRAALDGLESDASTSRVGDLPTGDVEALRSLGYLQ